MLETNIVQEKLSAFHIIVDEAGLCDFQLFMISVAPFTASVNGNCIAPYSRNIIRV